ncbi:MAG TPA: Ig-like domain-containing protein, partial [Acidimicrobiia bacterium]|nr:Ig-like domain-containing protein [Acidimicrobiia bacterium]
SKVDNKSRANLAAVDPATGALDPLWNPGAKGGPVLALTVSGSRLYVGGKFSTVAGANVPRLAAVDAVSGAVASAWRPAPDNWVATLVPSPDGTLVYAGGQFSVIGGRTQRFIAAIRTDTGTASSWTPSSTYPLLTQVLSPDGSRLYVGGAGYDFNGNRASAFNTALSGRPVWETRGDGNVQGLALSPAADVLYIGGHFSQQNFVPRQHMAAVRALDGVLTPFAPNVNGALGVWSVAVDASSVSIGGDFTLVAALMQQGYARFPSVGPTLAVTSGPADGASSSLSPSAYGGTVSAPGSTVAAVNVSLDGASTTNAACQGCGTASATWTYTPPALAEGRHTLDFSAVDAGTVPSATVRRTYTVDLTPPALTVTGGPGDGAFVNDPTPTYSGSATDAGAVAAVQASVDGAAFAVAGVNCTGCGTSSATWTWTPPATLGDGSHTVGFRAVDGAGLPTSSASNWSIVVDTVVPGFTTLTAPPGAIVATFSEPLSCSTVSKSDFSATVNGTARAIKTVVCTGV